MAQAIAAVVAAFLLVATFWRWRAATVVEEERRRIARNLHDGLAHELNFIAGRSRALLRSDPAAPASLSDVAAAAERALDESRRVIHALTEPGGRSLTEAIAVTAEQVAARAGAEVRLRLDQGIVVPASTQEELLRILREAVTNAVRHGRADAIDIELTKGERLRLRVRDDGTGFDGAAGGRPRGFGLVSMKERSHLLGADLQIRSWPGQGVEVEVVL